MCEKRKNGAEENIDLNKIQRSNGEWHRTKSFSKGKMIPNEGL